MTEKTTRGITTRVTLPAVRAVAGSMLARRSRLMSGVGFAIVVVGVGSLLKKRLDARRLGPAEGNEASDGVAIDPTADSSAVGGHKASGVADTSPVVVQGLVDEQPPQSEAEIRIEAAHAVASAAAAPSAYDAASADSMPLLAAAADEAEAQVAGLQGAAPLPDAVQLPASLNQQPIKADEATLSSSASSSVDAVTAPSSPAGVPTIVLPVASQPDRALPLAAQPPVTRPATTRPLDLSKSQGSQGQASGAQAVGEASTTQADPSRDQSISASSPTGGELVGAGVGGETKSDRSGRKGMIWSILGSVFLGLVVVGVIAATVIKLPYYRIDPGSVYDTIERVEAPVEQTFIPDGNISFVTVSQTSDINAWQWLDAKLDTNVLIRHEDEINGDQTSDEKREQDQRRMQVSKNAAVVVALERLGFDLISTPLGIEVSQVFACSAADGILNTGDLIVGVDDVEVRESIELVEQLAGKGIGTRVELLVDRIDPANSAATLRTDVVGLTLGSRDDACLPDDVRGEEAVPFIGIGTNTIYDEQLPVEVNIDTGRVGGPSAGLAFTLAIMDVLSEGELTNGLNIVVTGTIDREGNVGPVGGIHQKTIAVQRADTDLFIVPSCCEGWVDNETGEPLDIPTNIEEALEHAEDGFMVVGVANLDEALAAIEAVGGDIDAFMN